MPSDHRYWLSVALSFSPIHQRCFLSILSVEHNHKNQLKCLSLRPPIVFSFVIWNFLSAECNGVVIPSINRNTQECIKLLLACTKCLWFQTSVWRVLGVCPCFGFLVFAFYSFLACFIFEVFVSVLAFLLLCSLKIGVCSTNFLLWQQGPENNLLSNYIGHIC